eukprot:5075752-Prymnesium_polylepis.1
MDTREDTEKTTAGAAKRQGPTSRFERLGHEGQRGRRRTEDGFAFQRGAANDVDDAGRSSCARSRGFARTLNMHGPMLRCFHHCFHRHSAQAQAQHSIE